MRWLALADRLPFVRPVTERGAESHLDWVEDGLRAGSRRARRAASAAPAAPPSRPRPTSTSGTCCAGAKGWAGGDARRRCWHGRSGAPQRDGAGTRGRFASREPEGRGPMKVLAYTSPARGHLDADDGAAAGAAPARRRGPRADARGRGRERPRGRARGGADRRGDRGGRPRRPRGARADDLRRALLPHPAPPRPARGPRPRSGARRGPPRPRARRLDHLRRQGGGRARAACAGRSPSPRCSKKRPPTGRRSGSGSGRWDRRSARCATAASASLADGFDRRSRLPPSTPGAAPRACRRSPAPPNSATARR